VTANPSVFSIASATRVRWTWYYYGRARLPENEFVIDYRLANGAVRASTNATWLKEPRHADASFRAVELL
jgi:hypothetical protein